MKDISHPKHEQFIYNMKDILYPKYEQFVHNPEYLVSIQNVFNSSLNSESSRILAFRVDLRLPSSFCYIDNYEIYTINPIKMFIESLKSQIEAERKRKKNLGQKVHTCPVRYIWARERNTSDKDHYHLMILVSYEYYKGLGDYTYLNRKYLSGKIFVAWARAVQYMEKLIFKIPLYDDTEDYMPLVHFPPTGIHVIKRNKDNWLTDLFNAYQSATYLAKTATKNYGLGYRCFGSSSL